MDWSTILSLVVFSLLFVILLIFSIMFFTEYFGANYTNIGWTFIGIIIFIAIVIGILGGSDAINDKNVKSVYRETYLETPMEQQFSNSMYSKPISTNYVAAQTYSPKYTAGIRNI